MRKLQLFSASLLVLGAFFHWQVEGEKVVDESEVIVRIDGSDLVAQLLAEELGYRYRGSVRGFPNTYILIPRDDVFPTFSKRGMHNVVQRLKNDHRVLWAESQEAKQRQKRDFINIFSTANDDRIFNDELWTQEWYLQDTRSRPDLPKLDLNVLKVYRSGITGKGVRISILDDGIEYTHDDLKDNYDPAISYDCNDDDYDPLPRYEPTRQNSHGTRCAGEIAMKANNGKCGVGIAFNALIGGVKLLDGIVNDRIEGTALSYAQELVDIYSASWGPNDDGMTVDGPGRLATEAILRGITHGRNGKGCIYVWASGNGGDRGDNCNCDGYLSSPYTISIGSASQRGEFPWYGEACASTIAVTYSSGAYKDQMITTTDLYNQCTIKHTGTSAAAPLAAGIIALALEANPDLTWRDVQHLIIWTSEIDPLLDNPGWQRNAAGFWFNTRFGFGLMNAYAMVEAASNWSNVPAKGLCAVEPYRVSNYTINYGMGSVVVFAGSECDLTSLEHVEVTANIAYTLRGALDIYLTSPSGTKVQLLSPRQLDASPDGFEGWTFMAVGFWGETVNGFWTLSIMDKLGPQTNYGQLGAFSIRFHGSIAVPHHITHGPRNYNKNYNRVHNRNRDRKKVEKAMDVANFLKMLQLVQNHN